MPPPMTSRLAPPQPAPSSLLPLQSETHVSAETNARFETAKPNKADFVVEEGKKVDLATPVSVESESKMEVQTTESVAETVTPVHKVNRSVEVNVKTPSWLPEDWKFETKVRTNGASAGVADNVAAITGNSEEYWQLANRVGLGQHLGTKEDVEEQLLAVSLQWLYHSSRAKEMESGDRVCKEVVLHMHIRRKDLPKWKDALQMLNQIP